MEQDVCRYASSDARCMSKPDKIVRCQKQKGVMVGVYKFTRSGKTLATQKFSHAGEGVEEAHNEPLAYQHHDQS